MQTNKDKEKRINTKPQLINMVYTLNLFAECVYFLHTLYKKQSEPLIKLLCCAVLVITDNEYFYPQNLFPMLSYSHFRSFKRFFNEHLDCFICLNPTDRNKKYILSEYGSTTLQEFYSIFIEQLSRSVN